MNPESQAEFDRIVAIEPNALSESEAEFLKARRSYLTKEQSEVYADVLAEKPEKIKETEKPVKENKEKAATD